MSELISAISAVVTSGNCSGCGACVHLAEGISMEVSDGGYMRPRIDAELASERPVAEFDAICPGRTVGAYGSKESDRDAIFGSHVSVWKAWAADAGVRHSGSSGGTLTAISRFLLDEEKVGGVLMASADEDEPRRTLPLLVTDSSCAESCAGSRYAPVDVASNPAVLSSDTAVVAKPCEISAIRRLREVRGASDAPLLSFFCAGTPSQNATDDLVTRMGGDPLELASLRYRGEGWPGAFQFSSGDREASLPYEESWGKFLGPTMQWRCKICPDGIGESADVVAGDYWDADDRGYPVFDAQDGVSVLIARTERGDQLIRAALLAGAIEAVPAPIQSLYPIQPHQRDRRGTLAARLLGIRIAGGVVPKYRGFGLWRIMLTRHWRDVPRSLAGGLRRYRALMRADWRTR